MDLALYDYSLGIALVLMLFFALYFLVGKTPDKPIFVNYLRSRRIMGVALLVLSANYSVHLFCGLRPLHEQEAILMNFSTYFMVYWLFSAALTILLDRFYLTRRRFWRHMGYWALFTALSALLLTAVPSGPVQQVGLVSLALWLLAYGLWLARRLIRTYRWAVRLFDDTHSEYIAAYIRWMSIFTWWAVIYGVSCGVLTFLPDRYLFLCVNTRFFSISGTTGDMMIDTVGLSSIGLPDLQYHFHTLKPQAVMKHAYSVASLIYAVGPIMKSGETIDGMDDYGITKEIRWPFQYQHALIEPPRIVMAVTPGEYAV